MYIHYIYIYMHVYHIYIHMYVYICYIFVIYTYIYMYVCIYIYIYTHTHTHIKTGKKWLITKRVLESHISKMSVIYICRQKDRQCALPVITNLPKTHANLCTWAHDVRFHVPKCMSYHRAIGGLVTTGRAHWVGGGEISPVLFQNLKKKVLILEISALTSFIYGLNFLFKMLF